MAELLSVVSASGIAGVATFIGILLMMRFEKVAKDYSSYLISLAAGVLLGSAFFNIIPESLELNSNALAVVLTGFLLFYLIEHLFIVHGFHHDVKEHRKHAIGYTSIIGLAVHSLVDGFAIGIGFQIANAIGLIVAFAVIMHELPEGITAMTVLIHSGIKKRTAMIYSMIVALATPVGAIFAYYFLYELSKEALGSLFAIAAGSFIYIGASDLIPELHSSNKRFNTILLLIGVGLIYALGQIFSI